MAALLIALLLTSSVFAQGKQDPLRDVDLQQRLGERVPLDAKFYDEEGQEVTLARYFHGKPVVLIPAYYECPMLCTLILTAATEGLRDVDFEPGHDFEVVVFSIDPQEQPSLAKKKKLNYLNMYGRTETSHGWHFLTGQDASIRAVTDAIGYRYVYEPKTGQYAHPAAIAILSPEGKVSRYFFGNDYPAKDLRLGLIDAGEGKVGAMIDRIVARCYIYDPMTGRYGPSVLRALQIGAAITALGIAGLSWRVSRRVKRQRLAEAAMAVPGGEDGEVARSDSR